ncbi:MAG: hypothetical protein AB7O70_11710 [Hyphomicrobiales bacterium]
MTRKVFGFVEDPGSANFFVGLGTALERHGVDLDLKLGGAAVEYMRRLDGRGEDAGRPLTGAAVPGDADLLLVGTSENPESPAFDLLRQAAQKSIPSAAIVDSPASVSERFNSQGEFLRPDEIITAQEEVSRTVLACGLNSHGAWLVRHPYLDRLEDARQRMLASDRDAMRRALFGAAAAGKRVVVFLSEISDGLDAGAFRRSRSYTLAGRGASDLRTHIVLEEVLDALGARREGLHVVLRLHPKDSLSDYRHYAEEVDQISREEPAAQIVCCADAVIGMTTNMIAEAAILGARVLSVVPRIEEAGWLTQLTRPPVEVVATRNALRHAIDHLLSGDPVVRQRVDLDRPGIADTIVAIMDKRGSADGRGKRQARR